MSLYLVSIGFIFLVLIYIKPPSSSSSVMHILCPVLLKGGPGLINSLLPFVIIIAFLPVGLSYSLRFP